MLHLISVPQLLEDTKAQKEFEKAYQDFREDFWLPFSTDINEIFTTYSVPQDDFLPVFSFLYHHKFLIPILLEAPKPIKDIFSEVALSLTLDHDPEGKFEELCIVIRIRGEAEEVVDLLSKLDKAWFLKTLPKTRNQLNVTIEVQEEQH